MTLPASLAARFRVERPLGAGAYGAVYLARQRDLDRPVALKVLLPAAIGDEEQVRRFNREARLTAALDHPGIVKLFDHGIDEGVPWIAYELVTGGSLRERLKSGRLELADALDVALQVTEALGAAHRAGLIHRDVKPENVLREPGGRCRVADFGIARRAVDRSWETTPGIILGTPCYMAPETIRDRPAPSADLYAVGIMLWEMIQGTPPNANDDPLAVFRWHLRDERPALEGVPAFVSSLVEKSICSRPEDRFASADELARELSLVADRLGGGERVARRTRPAPRGGVFAVLGALTVVLGAVAVWLPRAEPPPATPRPAAPVVEEAARFPSLSGWRRGVPPPPERHLDAGTAVFDEIANGWNARHHIGEYANLDVATRAADARAVEQVLELIAPVRQRIEAGERPADRDLMLVVRGFGFAWQWSAQAEKIGSPAPLLDGSVARPWFDVWVAALQDVRWRALHGRTSIQVRADDLLQGVYNTARGLSALRKPPGHFAQLRKLVERELGEPRRRGSAGDEALHDAVASSWKLGLALDVDRALVADAERHQARLDAAWGTRSAHRWMEPARQR